MSFAIPARAAPAPALASSPPAAAPVDVDAAVTLTLDQALEYSRGHQPDLQKAAALIQARAAEAQIPRAAWLPRIGAAAQLLVGTSNNTTASSLSSRDVDLPRIGATRATADTGWAPAPSSLLAVTLAQQVYDFGRIAAQAAVADALSQEARASADAAWLDVRLLVTETFHAVRAAHQILGSSAEALRRAQAHYALADAGVRAGMRSPIERTRAQADLGRAWVQRDRAASGLALSQSALAAAIGSDQLAVDAAEPDAAATPGPGPDPPPRSPVSLPTALAESGRSPLIRAAEARAEAQRQAADAAKRDLLPNLSLSATLSGRAGGAAPSSGAVPYGDGWLPDVGNWHAALSLSGPLLDPVALQRRRAALARAQVAAASVDVARRAVALQVQRAYLDLIAAQRALPGLAATVAAGQANLQQAEARFRAGLGNIVELADAEAVLTGAELELSVGRFQVARARAQLEHATGAPQTRFP